MRHPLTAGPLPAMALVLPILLLAGCQKTAEQAKAPTVHASPATPAPAAPAPLATDHKVAQSNALYEFTYAYPAAAAAIPALKAWLDADLVNARSQLATEARAAKVEAKANDFPFNPHSYSANWQVVAQLPGWLSLSAVLGSDSGGAHPNHAYSGLLWDKPANRRRETLELFTTKAALAAAIIKPFCAALDKQRAQRRGSPVNRNSGDEFDKCINPVDEVVILGSSDHQHFTRIGVLVAPYDAGPYAEGDYEITLPITPAILAAVKPEYRASFAAGG